MHLSHDEMIERRHAYGDESTCPKAIEQAKLEADKAAFFAKGGVVSEIPVGVIRGHRYSGKEYMSKLWSCSDKSPRLEASNGD